MNEHVGCTTGLAPPWSWSWSWMRRWSAPRGTRPGVTTQEGQWEESLIPWPDKDLEEVDRDSRTQAEGLDIKAGTKYSLGGVPCVSQNTIWVGGAAGNEHQGQLCGGDTRRKTTDNSGTSRLCYIFQR